MQKGEKDSIIKYQVEGGELNVKENQIGFFDRATKSAYVTSIGREKHKTGYVPNLLLEQQN